MSGERLDELGIEEMRNRASEMVLAKGWKPGDRVHLFGVRELMVAFAREIMDRPPTDRCAYPACGCDFDAVCDAAIPANPS